MNEVPESFQNAFEDDHIPNMHVISPGGEDFLKAAQESLFTKGMPIYPHQRNISRGQYFVTFYPDGTIAYNKVLRNDTKKQNLYVQSWLKPIPEGTKSTVDYDYVDGILTEDQFKLARGLEWPGLDSFGEIVKGCNDWYTHEYVADDIWPKNQEYWEYFPGGNFARMDFDENHLDQLTHRKMPFNPIKEKKVALFHISVSHITPGIQDLLDRKVIDDTTIKNWLVRHVTGDWGEHGKHDEIEVTDREIKEGPWATSDGGKLNKIALLRNRDRVMSIYSLPDNDKQKIWVFTYLVPVTGFDEPGFTIVMLPSEY